MIFGYSATAKVARKMMFLLSDKKKFPCLLWIANANRVSRGLYDQYILFTYQIMEYFARFWYDWNLNGVENKKKKKITSRVFLIKAHIWVLWCSITWKTGRQNATSHYTKRTLKIEFISFSTRLHTAHHKINATMHTDNYSLYFHRVQWVTIFTLNC